MTLSDGTTFNQPTHYCKNVTGALESISFVRSQACAIIRPPERNSAVHYYLNGGESGFLKLDRGFGLEQKDFLKNRAMRYVKKYKVATLTFGVLLNKNQS